MCDHTPCTHFPFQAAEELGAVVFVHPWDMALDGRMKKYWLPWLVGEFNVTLVSVCMVFIQACPVSQPWQYALC